MDTPLTQIKDLCQHILDKVEGLSSQIEKLGNDQSEVVLDYLDVCQVLHISVRHLRRLHKSKELVGFKIGRRRYYRNSEVQQFIRMMEKKNPK